MQQSCRLWVMGAAELRVNAAELQVIGYGDSGAAGYGVKGYGVIGAIANS